MKISEQIKKLFEQLTLEEQEALLKELPSLESSVPVALPFSQPVSCACCGSKDIVKHSMYKHTQRFRCKTCGKTFLPTTGGLTYQLKKPDKFAHYVSIVEKEGLLTIKQMAKRVGISIPTSFEWRHKILLSIPKNKEKFNNETQMDDLWFLYSQKGRKGLDYSRKRGGSKRKGDNGFQVKIIAATDKKQVAMKVARIGRITSADIVKSMGDKFKKNTKLVTDAHRSYQGFAKKANLEHVSFLAKNHKADTGENVQCINNLAGRLDTWLNRVLRGVSTKYLQLYATYFAYTAKDMLDNKKLMESTTTWDVFMNIEKMYAKFIEQKSVRTYRCPTKRSRKAQNWNGEKALLYSYL